MAEKNRWTTNHSKTYIALSICIADGRLNDIEKTAVQTCVSDWISDMPANDTTALISDAIARLGKSSSGVQLLRGVERSSQHIAKGLNGDLKKMYRFLKQLKFIAESDKASKPASSGEARILRYAANNLGFAGKLSIELGDDGITMSRT